VIDCITIAQSIIKPTRIKVIERSLQAAKVVLVAFSHGSSLPDGSKEHTILMTPEAFA
jgi:hypothetical protein